MTTAPHPLVSRPDDGSQRWTLWTAGRRHRVEIRGSRSRTITWYVDDQLVATRKSTQDDVTLKPGTGLDTQASAAAGPGSASPPVGPSGQGPSTPGTVRVRFTDLGRPKRVTWLRGRGEADAPLRALVGADGIDFDPEPGSPAALRADRIRRHPRRHAAVAVVGGLLKVGIPLLIGLLGLRLTLAIPWPDVDLPSIPWPDWRLPAIPWPDWDLPSIPWPDLPELTAPAWVVWLVDRVHYIWPPVLAGVLARAEIRRQRQQDALKARLSAEASADEGRRTASAAASSSAGPGGEPCPER